MVRFPSHRPLSHEALPLDGVGFRKFLHRSTAKVLTALGLPLLFLVGLVLFLRAASEELDRSDRVIAQANQVEKALVTMNAGFRDFGLVSDPLLRASYLSARRELERPMSILRESVRTNARQERTWRELEAGTRAWARTTDATLTRLLAGASVESQRPLLLAVRSTYSTALANAQAMIEEEERLRAIRNQAISRVVNTMMAVFLLSAVVGVPALAWWIRQLLARVNGHYRAGLAAAEQRTGELQVSEGRLRFLNELSDATAPLAEPAEIKKISSQLLGRYLRASRCLYAELASDGERFEIVEDYTDDCGSVAGEHPMEVFGAAGTATLREGRGLWVRDAAAELAPEIAARFAADGVTSAFVGPVMRAGQLQALIVVQDKAVRTWSEADATLVGEVGDRCRTLLDRVQAEADLRRARDALQQASRAKDDFLAALSHELRTPLTPVLLAVAALCEDDRLPSDIRAQLNMMERNIALEARLIDDLLDLTRISRGKLELRVRTCDAHTLIRLVLEIVRPEAEAKDIHIEPHLDADWSGLPVDPERFQQVMWNLLCNAVKFTPRGGRIAVSTSGVILPHGGRAFRIEVADSGIGIEPDLIDRIFLPFEQGDLTRRRRFGGVGLGLAIARRMVELHGGRIEARSAGANQGATFTVELPGAVPSPAARSEPRPAGPGSSSSRPSAPLRLLLVEDHENTLQTLCRLLQRDGHQVTAAMTAEDAWTSASSTAFDLVISDLGLPDGSGLDLMGRLRATYGLKGIALSGYGMDADRRRSQAAGFVAHLVKPVNIGDLRQVLTEVAQAGVPAG